LVAAVQNTTVSLLRGTATDAYGDTVDAAVPVLSGVPAVVIERSQSVLDPATQTPMIVRSTVCVVPQWTGALATDQIRNDRTGDTFAIEDILLPDTLMGAPVDITLTLRRVTGAAT
jgi:hypothetical protein